jgi:hypothetical protein
MAARVLRVEGLGPMDDEAAGTWRPSLCPAPLAPGLPAAPLDGRPGNLRIGAFDVGLWAPIPLLHTAWIVGRLLRAEGLGQTVDGAGAA